MFLQLMVLFAEAEKAAEPTKGSGGIDPTFLFPMLAVLALVYFLFFRQRGGEAASKDTLDLQKNDKVLIFGYIIGHVVSVNEADDEVTVKLDENLRMKFLRASIHKNYSKEERAKVAKDVKDAPKG